MKAFLMRTGAGIALPLPGHVVAALGLRVGDAVEIHGPDADGGYRIVPVRAAGASPAPPPDASITPPSAADVARVLSTSASGRPPATTPAALDQELDRLLDHHGESLRELES